MNESFILESGSMPRTPAEGRLDELVDAAAHVFSRLGYRRTQMADVARELGVAAGTLYNYVASKEALFDLCVQRAFLPEPPPLPSELPVPTPEPRSVVEHVRERLARGGGTPRLIQALGRTRVDDPAAELEELVRELHRFLSENADGIRLIERSAIDRPDLAELYFGKARAGLIERWERYIESRVARGLFRPVPDVEIAARLVIETVAWFGWHRRGDPDGEKYDDALAEDTVATFLVRALTDGAGRDRPSSKRA